VESTTLNIKGMTCMGCVSSVTKVLKATPGVADAQVTLDPAQAKVQYDATLTSPAQLKTAVEDAGYEAA
jgi:copper chaperone